MDHPASAAVSAAAILIVVAHLLGMDSQEWCPLTGEEIVLDETIHQSTRLRIMSMLVSQPDSDRLAYGFIRKTLDLTGGT